MYGIPFLTNHTDIARMYGLLKLIPSGVDSLRDELEGYFKKQGLAAIEKCEDVTSVSMYVCMYDFTQA